MNARVRTGILVGILAVMVGFVVLDDGGDSANTRSSNAPGAGADRSDPKPVQLKQSQDLREPKPLELPERAELAESQTELFSSSSWQPPPPKVVAAPPPPPAPVAPPLPYRFAGQLIQGERPEMLLAKGDSIIPVGKGDTLDGLYRVESITESQITLLYLPLKQIQTIPIFGVLEVTEAAGQTRTAAPQSPAQASIAAAQLGTTAPAAVSTPPVGAGSTKPARLLWEGPQQVKLGAPFSVALKMTSEQSLRASPMQLRFDPAFLELVAARAGKYFGGGERNFTYRVNPDGSIFVGAANQNPAPTTDAELLVLTFRPLKPAPAAELTVASINLQGPGGHSIAFDPLAAFKTAITQ